MASMSIGSSSVAVAGDRLIVTFMGGRLVCYWMEESVYQIFVHYIKNYNNFSCHFYGEDACWIILRRVSPTLFSRKMIKMAATKC